MPVVVFSPKLTVPFNSYLSAVRVEKRSLTPDGERLRGRDEVVIGWGAYHHSISANICQTRLRSDCGAVLVCSHCCLKKNQNAPRPSEHPPVRGKKCQNV